MLPVTDVNVTSGRTSLYVPPDWALDVAAPTVAPPVVYPLPFASSVPEISEYFVAADTLGNVLVSIILSESLPRLWTFSATASANELNLLNDATGMVLSYS